MQIRCLVVAYAVIFNSIIEMPFPGGRVLKTLGGSRRVRTQAGVTKRGDLPLRRPKGRRKCHNQRARMCTTQGQQSPPHAYRKLAHRSESSPDA